MPPAGAPRPDKATHDGVRVVARRRARSQLDRESRSGPHRTVPSIESRRVPQRGSRPARPRSRRLVAAAGRRCELRVRQHCRRAQAVADADGAVPVGGAEGEPACRRHAAADAEHRLLPRRRRSLAGRPAAWSAARHARRHAHQLCVPDGRGLRDSPASDARPEREPAAVHRAAAARDQHRRSARRHVHAAGNRRARRSRCAPARRSLCRAASPQPSPGQEPARPAISQIAQTVRASAKERQSRNRADESWNLRVPVKAGQRDVVITFLNRVSALDETARLPFQRPYPAGVNIPETRLGAYLRSVEIVGPIDATGPGQSDSRRRIFTCSTKDDACARKILSTLARRAYRRPVTDGRRRAAAGVLPRRRRSRRASTRASSARSGVCW